jgi:hypothetical protein
VVRCQAHALLDRKLHTMIRSWAGKQNATIKRPCGVDFFIPVCWNPTQLDAILQQSHGGYRLSMTRQIAILKSRIWIVNLAKTEETSKLFRYEEHREGLVILVFTPNPFLKSSRTMAALIVRRSHSERCCIYQSSDNPGSELWV